MTKLIAVMVWTCWLAYAQNKPVSPLPIDIANAPIPMHILVESPAETDTDLQVICLFRSSPANTLHGSLVEMNDKLKGLLDRVRNPNLFRGELGETLLLRPPKGSLGARKLPAALAWRTRFSLQPSSMEESPGSPPAKSPNR